MWSFHFRYNIAKHSSTSTDRKLSFPPVIESYIHFMTISLIYNDIFYSYLIFLLLIANLSLLWDIINTSLHRSLPIFEKSDIKICIDSNKSFISILILTSFKSINIKMYEETDGKPHIDNIQPIKRISSVSNTIIVKLACPDHFLKIEILSSHYIYLTLFRIICKYKWFCDISKIFLV